MIETTTTTHRPDETDDRHRMGHMVDQLPNGELAPVAWCGAKVPADYRVSTPGDDLCLVCVDLLEEAGERVEDHL